MSAGGGGSKLTTLVLIIAAIGVPTSFAVGYVATQDPIIALVITMICIVVAIIIKFIAEVWKQLKSKWFDYEHKYRQYISYMFRTFDVRGLSTQGPFNLDVEQVQVFVKLSFVPGMSLMPDLFAIPDALTTGSHSIWEFVNSPQMRNIVVIGAPGSGKTTLLRYMALTLAGSRVKQKQDGVLQKLPVLLFLRNHVKDIQKNAQFMLPDAITNQLTKQQGPEAPSGWFKSKLDQGHCLVMMDGLDEVGDPLARKVVADWVERQMRAYGDNRFVVSSRPLGYKSNPLSGMNVLEVRPFTSGQVQEFVHNWYRANQIMSAQNDDPSVRLAAEEGAEDLLRRIRNTPSLSAFAVNPLLLTMIANVNRYRSSLPGRRVELYAEICEVFLGKRQQARGIELDLTPSQKQRVLEPLAFSMMWQQKHKIRLEEALEIIEKPLAAVNPNYDGAAFLKMVEDSSGLLLEREMGIYSFAHLTFQEFLAAVHIQKEKLENELIKLVNESWWHETIRLYTALGNATEIIAACLESNPPSVMALVLAIECVEEAREVQPQVRQQLERMITDGIQYADHAYFNTMAEAMLQLRIRRLIQIKEDTFIDNHLITQAEYQMFIDERGTQDGFQKPDNWSTERFTIGNGAKPVIGVQPSSIVAFCDWLTEREGSDWRYRLPDVERDEQITTSDEFSYWAKYKDGYKTVRVGKPQPHLSNAYALINHRFQSDLMQAQDPTLIYERAYTTVVELSYGNKPSIELDLALDQILRTLKNLYCTLATAFGLDPLNETLLQTFENATQAVVTDDPDATINLTEILTKSVNLISDYVNLSHSRSRSELAFRILELTIATIGSVAAVIALNPSTIKIVLDPRVLFFIVTILLIILGFFRIRHRALQQAIEQKTDLRISYIVLALRRACDLALSNEEGAHKREEFFRWYVRCSTITLVTELANLQIVPIYSPPRFRGLNLRRINLGKLLKVCLNLYVNFAIEEERRKGTIPVMEGILIVRERKQANQK